MNVQLRAARALSLSICALSVSLAQTSEAGKAGQVAADPGWPRKFTNGEATLLLHQPQIDSWKDFKKLKGRFALELTPAKGARIVYGTVSAEVDTRIDMETRTVSYANYQVVDIRFPPVASEEATQKWVGLTKSLLPQAPTSVSLDRILAYIDVKDIKPRETAVATEPPPILVSMQPAVLVIIDGKPIPMDIEKTGLQKILNTNWDLFFDKKEGTYYLIDNRVLWSSKTLDGAWTAVTKTPKEFKNLPDTEQYAEVKKAAASPQKPEGARLVLVVNKPSELIVIAGDPTFTPIPGTELMWVNNTEFDLFFDSTGEAYYFLTSGRWFRTKELKSGKWEAATTTLPAGFAKIPADHPRAHVLAAVPGTKEAELAVLMASIPQTAEIDRKTATAKVDYVGDPKFEQIQGTNISYATNTPSDVLKVGDSYYLCFEGVWFVAPAAEGPWQATDKVPEEVYAIPPSSPKHNVTYVNVYESTPDTVTYGYTSGYTGVYISYGVAMWGTGYYYPYYYGYGMYPYYWAYPHYTYGASAWYNPATGAYGRGSAVYGPYGGYARGAAYNPSTGGYAWGRSAWGPYGGAASGGFYNPSTGGWGGTARASNGYQTWGRSVVGRGDQWMRTGSYSDSRGSIGAFQTSGGAQGVVGRGANGQGGIVKSGSGDLYAGRNGNVYKRDQSGQWYKNSGSGSWDSVDRPQGGSAANRAESVQGLNRDASARQTGNYNTQRAQSARQTRSSGSYGGGGYSGSRSGGYSSRGGGGYRGGGRRR